MAPEEEPEASSESHTEPGAESVEDRQIHSDFGAARTRVRQSTPFDRNDVAVAIGRAFFDDPIAHYLFPDETHRRAGFAAFARLAMDQFSGAGATFVTDPVRGAAIWQSPSPPQLDPWRQISLVFRLLLVTRRGYARAFRLSEIMEKHQLPEPHWYLAILGTDPDYQGRGFGTALIEPILNRCDVEGTTAYLESSKEDNIPFYQRHGFAVSGEIRIPEGPVVWPMIRRPG